MTKRVAKTCAPDAVSVLHPAGHFARACEVYLPQAPQVFTYGLADGSPVTRGSVVWVQLGRGAKEDAEPQQELSFGRKKPARKGVALGLVAKVCDFPPDFPLKEAFPHASGYVFPERYMEALEWTARYYLSTPNRTLNTFWPRDLSKFLDHYASRMAGPPAETSAAPVASGEQPPLTGEQSAALSKLVPLLQTAGFRGALLHGVTGSGKTRVYLELARRALALGKRVLVLVPEIGLTPQLSARFSEFLGMDVPVLHSALPEARKRETWLSILGGGARIVLGTRSAILTPYPFDVVILDEEHDGSYKQQDSSPRYHCRELAFHIAHREGALVVLGSATPAIETFENAKLGHLLYLPLRHRATETKLPEVHVVDMRKKARLQQSGILLSAELREALGKCVADGNQAIVLLNRRGFSKARVCAKCGATLFCSDCHIPLVYHKQHNGLLCHYCGKLYPLSTPCRECGSTEYEFVGGAIEKLEEEILEWVPGAKVIRMDRDTTQNMGATEKILDAFRAREYNVLLGTQMVAKGHDFPGVQLVGVVGADSAGAPDYHSGERLYELLSQTAGRAGRAHEGGRVIFQTQNPEDSVMRFALKHDYDGFAEWELAARREAEYPPYCKVAVVEFGSRNETLLREVSEKVVRELSKRGNGVQFLGPVDSYIPRLLKMSWVETLVKGKNAALIRNVLAPLIENPESFGIPRDIEIRIDVDPM